MMSMTLFHSKKDLTHLMHGQTLGNCLFLYYKSPPFHSVIRIHLISLTYHILVILPSYFSSMWQMLMLHNCTILHLGRNNTLHNYSVNNVSLPDVTEVTDNCVLVDKKLRFTKQYRSIVNKANHRSSLNLN